MQSHIKTYKDLYSHHSERGICVTRHGIRTHDVLGCDTNRQQFIGQRLYTCPYGDNYINSSAHWHIMAACFNQLPDWNWHRYTHVYSILNRVIALVLIYLIFKLCTCTFILACRPPTLCCLMWDSNTRSSHSDCCTNRQQLTDKNLQGEIYFKHKFEVPNHYSIIKV